MACMYEHMVCVHVCLLHQYVLFLLAVLFTVVQRNVTTQQLLFQANAASRVVPVSFAPFPGARGDLRLKLLLRPFQLD